MKFIKFSAIVFLLMLLTACGGGNDSSSGASQPETTDPETEVVDTQPEVTNDEPLNDVIVVIGDSIGLGYGASIKYPDIIQGITGIEVINISKGGSHVQEGVSRIPGLIKQYRPKYIVMQLGTNNTALGSAGANDVISSLRYGAKLAIEAGIIPIIGTLPPNTRSSYENSAAAQASAGIRGISGARIAPIDVSLDGSHLQSDGKHPNNSGQKVIGRLFADQVY